MIKCNNLSKLGKNKNLLTYLQLNYRDSLGEFSNTSYGIFGAERVNINNSLQFWNDSWHASDKILCNNDYSAQQVHDISQRYIEVTA